MRHLSAFLLLTSTLFMSGCEGLAHWAYESGLSLEKSRAGLQDQTLTTADGIRWHLLRSEAAAERPVVLLIHGFGADSSNWLRFANELEGDFHFVIPDLPGHGQTTRTTDLDYTMAEQASRLVMLMDALDIHQYHVAGNSMGGAITLALAQQAPDQVLSIGLVDSAGLTRQTREFKEILATSDSNPLIPRSPEDFHTTLKWAMEDAPYMPDFFVDVMGEKKAANAAVADKIWLDLQDDPGMSLEASDRLGSITEPALVLWGREDRLLGVDNVAVFVERLPNARAVILDDIGHVPMAEAPRKSADAFRTFWLEAKTES
ncbi:MAG: alpha/beta fold hydrolase [Pseudomonadales bacterium]|nr:alpha/beta fold hydrolase [Pseudomonadales bacterium]